MKINIIAPNIRNGGGLELLLYLLEHLEERYKDVSVTVYVDSNLAFIIKTEQREVVYLTTRMKKIKLFSKKIDNAIYFGNLPPLVKSNNSIVYIHNPYLLINFKELFSKPRKFFIKYYLQQVYIKVFIHNINIVACQTKKSQKIIFNKYKVKNVELFPFFRLCSKKIISKNKKKFDLCYISLAHVHKNHDLLFNALHLLSLEGYKINIAVTVEKEKSQLIKKIESINKLGLVKITNYGMIPKSKVCEIYKQSKCLIFPSLEETFGLGLIEAISMGLDVIAPDLDYVYEVISPSLTFDPFSEEDCANAIKIYLMKKHKKSILLVDNKIEELINQLINI